EVEHPGLIVRLPQPAIAEVEPPRLGLAPAAVLLVHPRISGPDRPGDPGPHRALTIAAVGERPRATRVVEEIARDKMDGHGRDPLAAPPLPKLRGASELVYPRIQRLSRKPAERAAGLSPGRQPRPGSDSPRNPPPRRPKGTRCGPFGRRGGSAWRVVVG